MRLYFLRHGKTKWNLESRYQGAGGDSPLLATSYDEIEQAAAYLDQVPFRHVFSSPIKRAFDTALGVMRRFDQNPMPGLTLLSRLEEFHLGQLEGMTFSEAKRQFPAQFNAFRNAPDQYEPGVIGGESFPELIKRMTPAIQTIVQSFSAPHDNVLVVSHGAALNAEINALLGIPLAHLRDRGGLSNTSTTVLETLDAGQSFRLIDWNNTSYLTGPRDQTDTV
ncbi:histidine phosphatase family protein [Secundilactobacillus kimchicus]|uniref:histidine phosphatase family protein n=1 Tax=Secundilactobacillus kimchicus TaxID=528209 RepID=UPI0024A8B525|nr:histidine phosphatase family protein [Secundilactobacillus kimchicus]